MSGPPICELCGEGSDDRAGCVVAFPDPDAIAPKAMRWAHWVCIEPIGRDYPPDLYDRLFCEQLEARARRAARLPFEERRR